MKSNQNPIVAFAVQHVEKLVFGMAVLVMLGIVFFASQTEVYDKGPSDLASENDRAKNYMAKADAWESIKDLRKAETKSVALISEASKNALNAADYKYDKLLGTRLTTLPQRVDPQLFPPIDLRSFQISKPVVVQGAYDDMQRLLATLETDIVSSTEPGDGEGGIGGLGGFGGGDAGEFERGGGNKDDEAEMAPGMIPASLQNVAMLNPLSQNWNNDSRFRPYVTHTACVQGLVPYEKQWQEFDSKLRDAQGWYPLRDRPNYVYMEIQRRADGGGWTDITEKIQNVEARVAPYAQELQPEFVEPIYTHYVLTRQVLPFMGFDFRLAALHPKTEGV